MAGSSLLALLDDIATVLDDVAAMTKVATKKTAGVLGDDLALNAQQVTGVRAERELPVVWAVAKGSTVNKLILVPAALAISAVAPWAVTPLLMLGGLFLCYEGVEKLAHKFLHSKPDEAQAHAALVQAVANPEVDLVAFERDKIKGAVRTDFILSAEIIVITLGTVATAPFGTRVAVLCAIAAIMTVGVYGLVAGIVKLDDFGQHLVDTPDGRAGAGMRRAFGRAILAFAPRLMKALSFFGTAAMFLVGGGILTHGIHVLYETFKQWGDAVATLPAAGVVLGPLTPMLLDLVFGMIAGALALLVVKAIGGAWTKLRGGASPTAG
jgi:predicted DNA repair protein MutK